MRPQEVSRKLELAIENWSWLYADVARTVVDAFGQGGEWAIHRWLREWAIWRGGDMRQAHEAVGWPINVETLLRHWDSAALYVYKNEFEKGFYSPNKVNLEESICRSADIWEEAGIGHLGLVLCEEIHQYIGTAYHPDIVVALPTMRTKGDPICRFRCAMPPQKAGASKPNPTPLGERLAENYRARNAAEAGRLAMKRYARNFGGFCSLLAKQMIETYGHEGEEVVRQLYRKYAEARGRRLRVDHERVGLAPTPANAIKHNDEPYYPIWKIEEHEVSDTQYIADIIYCPYAEAWADLGQESMGSIYCTEVYPAMLRGYEAHIECEIPQIKSKSDPICAFRFVTSKPSRNSQASMSQR